MSDEPLSGPADPWDHQAWVSAWGRNATLIYDGFISLPTPPDGVVWLVTRILVNGVKGAEVALVNAAEDYLTTLDRQRCLPEPSAIIARATEMLQRIAAPKTPML